MKLLSGSAEFQPVTLVTQTGQVQSQTFYLTTSDQNYGGIQTAESSHFHGVPLINPPGPMPYGEQALKFPCSALPACVTLSVLFGLWYPRSYLSVFHWELPDHWPEPNSPFLQNSSICKPGNSAGQSCSQSLGHYWSKLILLKCHTFRRNSHLSIKLMVGFCIQCQTTEHFLIAIN